MSVKFNITRGRGTKNSGLSLKKSTTHKAYNTFALGAFAFLAAYVVASVIAPVKNSSAETQEVAAKVLNTDTQISITPGQEKVTLNVGQPDPTGTFISGNDTLTAKSTSDSGYQLYVSMDNNHTNGNRLYLNGDESSGYISANNNGSGTDIVYPTTATLAKNTWGLTFSAEDNNNQVYGAAPLMGNEYLLKTRSTATPIEGDAVPVWYAVKVDTNMVTGTYSGNILYTIIAEASNADLGIPSINPQAGALNDTVNISVPLQSTLENNQVSDLGTITAKIGNESCNITNTTLGGATVNITCTVPQLTVGSTYNVSVYIQKYDSTYVAENAFEYTSPTLANIQYMQDVTSDICAATPETMTLDNAYTLIDSRGKGNAGSQTGTYRVIKAKDGNCWMIDNLNLYNYTISAETSDFTSPANYTIPAGITATTDWNTNNYTTKKVEISHGLGQYATQDQSYWNEPYYNWTVAVAKETTAGVTTAPDTSICPKGWTLPTNGDSGVNKSWARLFSNIPNVGYNYTAGSQFVNNTNILGFTKYYGDWVWNGASEYSQGSGGYFWSGTPSAETNAYYLHYNSGGVYPQINSNKGHGFSIRCVAR